MSVNISALILMASASVATIAAYMAHRAFERDAAKASEAIRLASVALEELASAIASVRASRASRLEEELASKTAISAFAQVSASCHRRDCGPEPKVPLASSRSTSNAPIERQSSSSALSMDETPRKDGSVISGGPSQATT